MTHPLPRWAGRLAGLILLGGLGWGGTPVAGQNATPPWDRLEAARALLGESSPTTGRIAIELPAVSQDGSSVPLGIQIDYPMTGDDFVEELHLFASGNPSPEILTAHFTPLSGEARLQTRVRLDGSQRVIALARTSQGEWLAGSREIRITVSGCISAGKPDPNREMEARVRPPDNLRPGEVGEILTLIQHPMETGLRRGDNGAIIPQRIIQQFRAKVNDQPVLTVQFHRSVSANPFLRFPIQLEEGGQLHLEWEEDTGRVASETALLSL